MSILESIILGIVQGLSEFIPISSTAHMTLTASIFGLIDPNNPQAWTAFMAVIQLGTLVALLIYFKRDIYDISRDFLSENIGKRLPVKQQSANSKLGWYVILGSVPIVTIGLALKKVIEGNLTKDLNIIAFSMIFVGLLLGISDWYAKRKNQDKTVNLSIAIIIGLAQCVALLPGSSRSGTTMTAALFLGLSRYNAARFSFLLSIPAIFGSGMYELIKTIPLIDATQALTMTIATIVSGIAGYYSIAFLLNYLRTRSTLLFVSYRIIFGIIVLLFIAQ